MKLSELLIRIQNLPEDTDVSMFNPNDGVRDIVSFMYKNGEVILY
jgi:hypothetical protein